jgi:hypothetical protein
VSQTDDGDVLLREKVDKEQGNQHVAMKDAFLHNIQPVETQKTHLHLLEVAVAAVNTPREGILPSNRPNFTTMTNKSNILLRLFVWIAVVAPTQIAVVTAFSFTSTSMEQQQRASQYYPQFFESLPSLNGKTVVITGCSRGLGFVTAKAVAQKGGAVIMLNRP